MNETLIKSSIENFLQQKSRKYSELYLLFLEFFQFYFREEAKRYIKNLDEMPELRKTEDNEFLEEIQALLTQAYLLGQTEEHMRITDNLSMYSYNTPEVEVPPLDAKKYAEMHAGELIKGINETTKNEINTIISLGLLGGQSKYEIAEQIKNTFDGFSLYRANLITHMEITTAYNKASRSTNDKITTELGVIGYKRAITQKDDKVRNEHKENEKIGWIPKNEKYPMETLNDFPPFDFNCRCSEVFSVVNPETGKLFEEEGFGALGYGYSDDELKEFYEWVPAQNETIKGKKKEFQQLYNLSDEEFFSIERFSGLMYHNISRGLMNPNKRDGIYKASIKFLLNGIRKMPIYQGVLWRGHKAYNDAEAQYLLGLKQGDIYENKHLFSSSSNKNTAIDFMRDNPYNKKEFLFHITTKKARNIHPITLLYEKESVFFPRQLFIIDKIEEKDNIYIIYMSDL